MACPYEWMLLRSVLQMKQSFIFIQLFQIQVWSTRVWNFCFSRLLLVVLEFFVYCQALNDLSWNFFFQVNLMIAKYGVSFHQLLKLCHRLIDCQMSFCKIALIQYNNLLQKTDFGWFANFIRISYSAKKFNRCCLLTWSPWSEDNI